MKPLFSIFLLAGIMLLFSCQQTSTWQTTLRPKVRKMFTPEDWAEVKQQFENRLAKSGYANNSVEVDAEKGAIILRSDLPLEEEGAKEQYRALIETNSVDIWKTYRRSDAPFTSLALDSIVIDGFQWMGSIAPEGYPAEELGVCEEESKLGAIKIKVENILKDVPNLRVLWSYKKKQIGLDKFYYTLYLIDTRGKGAAPINDQHFTDARVKNNVQTGGLEINFSMDAQGAKAFAKLTTEAAANDNRSLAIVINNRVHSVPRVMSPITGGQCSISGDYDLQEAHELALKVKYGRLKFPFHIVDEKVID